ncbi:YihY/virulence factor BrkB family protein [Parvibaculum sp.]|jgi:membrane protein|uniref:YihY/virulence factor BrkB family protein n=1 Tax=Parvibaculum sp. TaxID=2024848 RepID=UPI000C53B236|nr:YihY/virulence factor BrkB family protein [Parvibaculum sp.]MAM94884.1 ribonuclease [Parvibaculum sp.]|tara:strand:- start:21700 stop:22683 length:984 start_codon:yes stop_codon:yes gene_type:complete
MDGKAERPDNSGQNLSKKRGHYADAPSQIPRAGWKEIAWRVWGELARDRVTLVAAGVTFYILLALFPALAAFVSIYGFVADPKTIADHIAFLGGLLPSEGLELIRAQLDGLLQQNTDALGLGFLLGLGIALWSANNSVKALFQAMNVAYEEREKRSILRLHLVSFSFTLGAILIGVLFLLSVGVVPAALALLHLDGWTEWLIALGRWPVMLFAVGTGISLLYRYGPSRAEAKLRWITWGSGIATMVWIAASIGFSFYLENFANYNATYGALGAVIGLMMWCWLSVVILLVGAELNAEIEHQTARDSTTGERKPMGERGAVVADTLGE